MNDHARQDKGLFDPVTLPCGVTLKNRIAKSAMSDSLGDGTGHPTQAQNSLYQRWANGGTAISIIGEVQSNPNYAEKPGNLVLNQHSEISLFKSLAIAGGSNDTQLWLQLGHAGALSYEATSIAAGPSALDLPGLQCRALTLNEIRQIPAEFAKTARLAQQAGFGGVQIHAAHGFLLSQFLSPLFNKRTDSYGGSIANRLRLLQESITATRAAVGPRFPIAVKLNSSDQLENGFDEADALAAIAALNQTSIDLIDISGGTYFPGAKAASEGTIQGPNFLEFAKQARRVTGKPLMVTGGFKTRLQAEEAISGGIVDVIGLARALAIAPDLPNLWKTDTLTNPVFPKFTDVPEGGITAWYTMRLTEIAEDKDLSGFSDLHQAIREYDMRDKKRTNIWLRHFTNQQTT